jgi:hypothetical protein
MAADPNSELSTTQRTMLDLALACDLKVSDVLQHDAIQSRHHNIRTQRDAADYIREVENKVHSRRKFRLPPKRSPVAVPAAAAPAKVAGKFLTGTQASLAVSFTLVFMVAAGWFAPAGLNFVLVTLSLLLVMVLLGYAATGCASGILVNERNLMSLSRFQTVIWTVTVLGAYLTFALVRIRMMATGVAGGSPIEDPLAIQMDWHLWALLGLSTTSLVGAPLILSTKKDQEPQPSATEKSARMANESTSTMDANRQGTLYANGKMSDARMTDMFEGDELMNTARLDLAKVQMFYFTIIAAICFFVMVFKALLVGASNLDHLPVLPDGLVAILGISHAGYLTSKGIGHTPAQPPA